MATRLRVYHVLEHRLTYSGFLPDADIPDSVHKRLAASDIFVLKCGHKLCPGSLGRFRYIQLFQLSQIILTSFYALLFRCGLRCFSGKWSTFVVFRGVCSGLLCSLVEGGKKRTAHRPGSTSQDRRHPEHQQRKDTPDDPKSRKPESPQDWLQARQ